MAIDVATVRKVARLARIAEPEERLEALAQELNGIMKWIEQLAEVDTDGVEPLTSVVAAGLPLRDDVVTMGGDARVTANAPKSDRRLLRRAEGRRIMSSLTKLTLKAAVDGLTAKATSPRSSSPRPISRRSRPRAP
jgi:aspartyl-tRNA(Asn)/glutamyl-tRNA(Gln) amidotransferase subunit C